ncbi:MULTISPECIES: hypothetical protein [Trichocoleus]|uniref:Uncharacterized protein n=1 Tax=Trichocoleus desertorum GB2-A4 TaxID=2933944 RepID=A0ABV0J6S9_9CYAN|nr:hypothetical protein [Trichocoleus sp. FACHB-46]MBD1862447.1 hypothetical protein [Trichocoleus sp. FACHB-46]
MQKFSYLAIAAGLTLMPLETPAALPGPSSQLTLLAASQNSMIADAGTPLCYMQTTNQGLVDLSHLCQRSAPTTPSNPQVVVLGFERSGDRVVGQVRNDTGKPVRFAIVNYAVAAPTTDAAASFTYVTPETLQPGQTGNFEGTLSQPGTVTVTSVEWEAEPNS